MGSSGPRSAAPIVAGWWRDAPGGPGQRHLRTVAGHQPQPPIPPAWAPVSAWPVGPAPSPVLCAELGPLGGGCPDPPRDSGSGPGLLAPWGQTRRAGGSAEHVGRGPCPREGAGQCWALSLCPRGWECRDEGAVGGFWPVRQAVSVPQGRGGMGDGGGQCGQCGEGPLSSPWALEGGDQAQVYGEDS